MTHTNHNDWTGLVTEADGTISQHALSMVSGGQEAALTRLKAVHQQMVDCCDFKPAQAFTVRVPTPTDRRNLSF